MDAKQESSRAAPGISPRLLWLFHVYLHWYLPRHFHSLRIANAERFPAAAHPLIVCINHPSWWDPLTILMVSRALAPGRFAYAPMEAEALEHYGFFRKLGAFPVDNTSPRAGAQFVRQAKEVLMRRDAILWMTPEGHFTDVRERPVTWKSGVAALTRQLDRCTVVPLAIEYTFWDERLPEILCYVGESIQFASTDPQSTEERTAQLVSAMTQLQDDLASCARQRDGSLFTSIFAGSAGVSASYDLWQRLKAAMRGNPYIAEHGRIARK
jgi:1-acyl-sn-glycerol-3-phosphate acyltransferase